jgi:hypothetical protein
VCARTRASMHRLLYVYLFTACIVFTFQVRPGVMTVPSRQNQLPALLFKSGTVVPIQQASGQLIRELIFIVRGPESQIEVIIQVLTIKT